MSGNGDCDTAVSWYGMVSPSLIAGMEPSSLLKEYGKSVGLPALGFDAHGCARLRFDSGGEVNLEVDPSGEWIHLYAVLGPVLPGPNDGLYLRLLQANNFGADTRGATLSIDPSRNEILLCQRVATDVRDAFVLGAAIENFGAAAREWTGSLSEADGQGDGPAAQHSQAAAFDVWTHRRA